MKTLAAFGALLLGVGLAIAVPGIAAADPCQQTPGAGSSSFHTTVTCATGEHTDGDDDPASALPPGEVVTTPVCEPGPQGGCIGQKHCPDGQGMTSTYWETIEGEWLDVRDNCSDSDPGPDPVPTQTDIRRAFEQVPLPASALSIQPPGGATLVNLDTSSWSTRPACRLLVCGV